jgi:hypothetical protein
MLLMLKCSVSLPMFDVILNFVELVVGISRIASNLSSDEQNKLMVDWWFPSYQSLPFNL